MLSHLFVSPRCGKLTESGARHLLQHGPHHLVPHPAHVEGDAPVQLPRLGDDERVRSGDLGEEGRARVGRLHLPPKLLVAESKQREIWGKCAQ